MTIAPYRSSPLYKSGLRYYQGYNGSKDIFAAGKQYLFGNPNFDTLALDPAMLRTWQHIGGAISHSPLALARGYVHTKQRTSAALEACRSRSYSTREEYRVTGTVLVAIDEFLCTRGVGDVRIAFPTDHIPFWIHPTPVMLDWWRWNINRLCVGFEMTFSLRPRAFVHWEHTRVMMMFLKCLLHVYGGQGGHPRRSLGLWIDRRTQPVAGSEDERIQEGMGLGSRLQESGYGWLANKLSWPIMVFLPSCRSHMVFNTPSLQSAYIARYAAVKQVKGDFLLFHDVMERLRDHHTDPRRSALLLQLLVDLCLRAFRQDVFRALASLKNHQPFDADSLSLAQAGDMPLDLHGVQSVFQDGVITEDLHVVDSARADVAHIETLFLRLWGWDGDGNHGDWQRKHWEYKPYRVFYRQCFGAIAQCHGMEQAREWRTRLKQTFIRSHWILPYPSPLTFWNRSSTTQRLQIWSSVHRGVRQFCESTSTTKPTLFTPEYIDYLPLLGWECREPSWQMRIQLPPIPTDLDAFLRLDDTAASASHPASVPLPAPGTRESRISTFCRRVSPAQRTLRKVKQEHQLTVPDDQIHRHRRWLRQGLIDHLQATIRLHQQELNDRNRALLTPRSLEWRTRPRPTLASGLAQLQLTTAQLEDDSDSDSFRADRRRHEQRLQRVRKRLREAQRETTTLDRAEQLLARHADGPSGASSWESWEKDLQATRRAYQRKHQSQQRLQQLSKSATRAWL